MINQGVSLNQNNMAVSEKSQKCFSIFIALYPILCIYKAFYKFTIGDIILILFFATSLFGQIKKDRRFAFVAVFAVYAFFDLCVNLIFSRVTGVYISSSLMFRLIKFIFYMLCVFTCGKKYFDFKVFQKTLLIAAAAACFYMIFQYVMYYGAGKIVLGRIPGLTLYLDEYSKLDYSIFYSYNFRPSSFFLEPALFCHYIIVALILTLFTNQMPKGLNRIFMSVLLTAGIPMSTAGQGILYLIIAYMIFGLKGIKKKSWAILFIFFAVVVALICYNKIEVFQYAVDRLLFNSNASYARLGTYRYVFNLDGLPMLFGYGYGTTPNNEYLAGAAYVWYGCGIIGFIMSLGIFGTFYRNANNWMAKTICITFFVMFFGTGLFYNYMLCWYFTIILCTSSLKRRFDE